MRGDGKPKKENISAFGRELVPALKKSSYVLAALILLTLVYLAGSWHSQKKTGQAGGGEGRRILYYVDPMNPAHTSPEPGLAPCGMKMEPVYAEEAGQAPGSSMPPGTVKISPEKQQIIGVRLAKAGKTPYTHTLRALGKVVIDETRVYRLISFAEGWILKVYNNSTGSLVQKDEILASYYSRDFITAEQAYFYALSTMERLKKGDQLIENQEILTSTQIRAAEENLENMGMGKLQIQEIAKTRKLATEVYLRAPATSFVTFRDVTPGQKLSRGAELYRLADLSQVWVLVDLFENEAQYVRPGEKVKVSYPHQKRTFEARVSEVLPTFDPVTRTLKVRLEVNNPGYLLRPEMFVDVELPVKLPPAVTVPVDALLDSGLKKTVFVDRGQGFFEPRQVETGWRLGDRVEILKGLAPGERIVVSGNFLIDSESRMKLAAAGMHGSVSRDPVCGMNVDESKARALGRQSEHKGQTYYFCCDKCKEKFDQEPAHFLGQAAGTPEQPCYPTGPGKAQVMPATAKDPVCGMEVDEAQAREAGRKSEYQGKTYYFCCNGCKQQFEKSPESFLGQVASKQSPCCCAASAASPEKATARPAAVKDPVCGMELNEATLAGGVKSEYRGKTYHFCCENCKKEFDQNPERYVAQAAAVAATPGAAVLPQGATDGGHGHD